MNRSRPLSVLAVSLLLANSVQAATNAGTELRRLQGETRDNLRSQPTARQDAQPGWSSPSAQAAATSQSRHYVQATH